MKIVQKLKSLNFASKLHSFFLCSKHANSSMGWVGKNTAFSLKHHLVLILWQMHE